MWFSQQQPTQKREFTRFKEERRSECINCRNQEKMSVEKVTPANKEKDKDKEVIIRQAKPQLTQQPSVFGQLPKNSTQQSTQQLTSAVLTAANVAEESWSVKLKEDDGANRGSVFTYPNARVFPNERQVLLALDRGSFTVLGDVNQEPPAEIYLTLFNMDNKLFGYKNKAGNKTARMAVFRIKEINSIIITEIPRNNIVYEMVPKIWHLQPDLPIVFEFCDEDQMKIWAPLPSTVYLEFRIIHSA